MDHARPSVVSLRKFSQTTSNDRCCFLLLNLFFNILILIIVCVRLEQFNTKQEKLYSKLKFYQNLTFQHDFQNRLVNHNSHNIDCSCQIFPFPKRNRTTNCLDLNVGLNDIISNVFCPNSEHGQNHWLTIQSRQTAQANFNQSWIEYRRGFGNVINQTDFWIGNENLYWLTNNYQCRLKIELTDWHNETRIAIYEFFRISSQNDDYRIQIDEYSGNIDGPNKIDSFSRWHHNVPFSTYDHFTIQNINCPNLHGGGGWWYHSSGECAHVQLNGRLATHSDGLVPYNTGILWVGWKANRHYSFQRVRMSIQPKSKLIHHHHQIQ